MGLCKCPKRKVTNQFCFEHRVNVCEYCMIQRHPKCVVQSYLQWLQDSDYSPNCRFCHQELAQEECVRLTCFHVFHWVCLDKYARSFPPSTAPAGYTCPECKTCIFPPDNAGGPVVEELRKVLKDVNWARAGLGLPLLEERVEKRPEFSTPVGPRPPPEGGQESNVSSTNSKVMNEFDHRTDIIQPARSPDHSGSQVIQFDTPTSRPSAFKDKVINNEALLTSPLLKDPDENKYHRKSGIELLIRWAKTFIAPSARRRNSKVYRYTMLFLLLLLVFVTFLALMSYLSESGDYSDPMLDPMNNPNIHVASNR